MTDQQQQGRSSSSTGGTDGRPPSSKSSNTTGNNNGGGSGLSRGQKKKAARDRKKTNNKQKSSNQQPKFKGRITDSADLMYGHVITPGEDMADQCRILKRQIKLYCSKKGHYRLSNSITSNTTLRQDDFLSPRPDPLLYSTTTKDATGKETTVIDTSKQDDLRFIWGKNITNDIAEWTKYEQFSKGLFETTMGQLDDKVLATCRQDNLRWFPIDANNDLIALLQLVEMICTQNKAGRKVYAPFENMNTIERCMSSKQDAKTTTTEYAAQVNVMYNSVIHQCGEFAFGLNFLIDILDRHGTNITAYNSLSAGDADKVLYDAETRDLIIAMLILRGSNNVRARECIKEQYLLGTRDDDAYPNTETQVITLLDSLERSTGKNNNNNNNNKNNKNNNDNNDRNEAVVAAHDVDYEECYDSDNDTDDDESIVTSSSMEEADEAKILANVEEGPSPCPSPSAGDNANDLMATVLANAVAEYDEELQEIEDGFIDRIDKQQDVDDAFDDDEPFAVACAHLVIIDNDDVVGDDFVVVNEDPPPAPVPGPPPAPVPGPPPVPLPDVSVDKSSVSVRTSAPRLSPAEEELQVTRDAITAIYAVAVIKFKNRSHTINNIIEYADALLFKLSTVEISSATQLHGVVENGSDAINNKLTRAGHSKLHKDTIDLIRKESWKSSCFTERQSLRAYKDTITMIGDDDPVAVDPANSPDQSGIRVFIELTAKLQRRRAPIRWTNNVTHKLISCGIRSKWHLRDTIRDGTLNDIISGKDEKRFNKITISGIDTVMKTHSDFHQGRL
jgi:hypothetical protein